MFNAEHNLEIRLYAVRKLKIQHFSLQGDEGVSPTHSLCPLTSTYKNVFISPRRFF